MQKKSLLAAGAILTAVSLTAPAFASTVPGAVQENGYTLVLSSIVVNGQAESKPYTFATKDPNDGVMTTFVPIWYIMQVLNQSGFHATWNGNFSTPGKGILSVTTSSATSHLHIQDSKGTASIMVNGQTAETGVPNIPLVDPNGGTRTSFFAIYYAQQLLSALGFQSSWNGRTWAITPPGSPTTSTTGTSGNTGGGSTTTGTGTGVKPPSQLTSWEGGTITYSPAVTGLSPTPANIAAATQQAQQQANEASPANSVNLTAAEYYKLLSTYGSLSTATQWYNDPGVSFYNKSFPVADMKDGYVIQQKPYTVVMSGGGLQTPTGTPEDIVAQYIGYGSNPSQGNVTVWKEEWVNSQTGQVLSIPDQIGVVPVTPEPGAKRPGDGQGINFGTNVGDGFGSNDPWAVGLGLDVVPIPSWSPPTN